MLIYNEGKERLANREFSVVHVKQLYPEPPHATITIRPGDINNLISALIATGFEEDILDAIEEYHMEFERT